jgi:hypothetical protein
MAPIIGKGQPDGFSVATIIPTEPANRDTPVNVVDAGDTLTLRTYLHVNNTVTPILKNAVKNALAASGKVEYHLQDLETGAMVPTIAGGPISKLTAAQIATAIAAGGDLAGLGLPATGDYYLSADTAPITTGPGNTLKVPAGSATGTWRVLTLATGGAGTYISAFDDGLFIEVEA